MVEIIDNEKQAYVAVAESTFAKKIKKLDTFRRR
jgi:hypothetical protein